GRMGCRGGEENSAWKAERRYRSVAVLTVHRSGRNDYKWVFLQFGRQPIFRDDAEGCDACAREIFRRKLDPRRVVLAIPIASAIAMLQHRAQAIEPGLVPEASE